MAKIVSEILSVIVLLVGIAMLVTPWAYHYTGYHAEADIVFALGALVLVLGAAGLAYTSRGLPRQRLQH